MQDLIDQARRNPGKLAYGTAGLGSETHMLMEKIGQMIQGRMMVVPYKGGGPAIVDLVGGQIPLVIQPIGPFMSNVRAGKLRILAVMTDKRWVGLPDVPTVREFLPAFTKPEGGSGIWGPAGMAPEIATRLQTAISGALHSPEVEKRLGALGAPVVGSTPEKFAQDLKNGLVLYRDLVKAAGVKPR